jgi:hypothetical protein
VENYLHRQVCDGEMKLAVAQRREARNWVKIYRPLAGACSLLVFFRPGDSAALVGLARSARRWDPLLLCMERSSDARAARGSSDRMAWRCDAFVGLPQSRDIDLDGP